MCMPSNTQPLQIKPAVKISVLERFSLSILWNKDTCDEFGQYKYILVGKGTERTLRDHLSLYHKAGFARSVPLLTSLCLNSAKESVAPWVIYSSAHLSFLLGNVSNVWPKSSLLQFKPITSCLIPSGHGEQFITFLSATTFYIVEGCYHVSPSVFSSLD